MTTQSDSDRNAAVYDEMRKAEKGYVNRRRQYLNEKHPNKPGQPAADYAGNGLAFSGGGIRSACFNLGVAKGLYEKRLFKQIDYLSTVSGGGYIGSAISWFYQGRKKDDNRQGGRRSFPFGDAKPIESQALDNHWVKKLTYGANYLAPGGGIGMLAFLGAVIRSILANLVVWGLLLFGLFWGALRCGIQDRPEFFMSLLVFDMALGGAAILGLFLLLSVFVLSILSIVDARVQYSIRRAFSVWAGLILRAALVLGVLGSLPLVHERMAEEIGEAGGLISFAIGIFGLFKRSSGEEERASIGLVLYCVLALYGLLLSCYALAVRFCEPAQVELFGREADWQIVIGIIVPIVVGLVCNTNYVSIGRYYRDRLMELFLPGRRGEPVMDLSIHPEAANDANKARLSSFVRADYPTASPYHIINCNQILVDSENPKYRSRGGDNFIFSPLYCGSNATTWKLTEKYMNDSTTLATAMAISGAAASPNAGCGGMGITRNGLVSLTMRLFNIRLGAWVNNPMSSDDKQDGWHWISRYNHFRVAWRALIGGLKERAGIIELSDGGHFSNLALYELARRKLPLVIVCDAGADPEFTFSDFKVCCDRIRSDFGHEIHLFPRPQQRGKVDSPLADMIPSEEHGFPGATKLAKTGHLFGEIVYQKDPENGAASERGFLIYLKTSLTPGLSRELLNYKSNNPCFPDVTTADQFFDEAQVTAYAELGYELSTAMVDDLENKLKSGDPEIIEFKPVLESFLSQMKRERPGY